MLEVSPHPGYSEIQCGEYDEKSGCDKKKYPLIFFFGFWIPCSSVLRNPGKKLAALSRAGASVFDNRTTKFFLNFSTYVGG